MELAKTGLRAVERNREDGMQYVIDAYTDRDRSRIAPLSCRVLSDGRVLCMIANGSLGGFHSGDQAIIDIVHSVCGVVLENSGRTFQDLIDDVAAQVKLLLQKRFPGTTDDEFCVPDAEFALALFHDSFAQAAWIGSGEIVVLRDDVVSHRTDPDVFDWSEIDKDSLRCWTMASITASIDGPSKQPKLSDEWSLRHGDNIIIADHRLFAVRSTDELVASIRMQDRPAKALVESVGAVHVNARSAIVVSVRSE